MIFVMSTTTRGQQTVRLTCGTTLFDFAVYSELIVQIRLTATLFCLNVGFFSKTIDVLKTRNSQAKENHYSLIVSMHANETLMLCLKLKRCLGSIWRISRKYWVKEYYDLASIAFVKSLLRRLYSSLFA